MAIYGDTANLKNGIMEQLKVLEKSSYPKNYIVSPELALDLAAITNKIGREIAVYIDRHGNIIDIMLGDKNTAPLKKEHNRRSIERLAGIRCIHTHPSGSSVLSELDLCSLREYKLDAMVAIGTSDGLVKSISIAILHSIEDEENDVQITRAFNIEEIEEFPFLEILREIDKKEKSVALFETETEEEITLLFGFKGQKNALLSEKESLEELFALAQTAGAIVKDKIIMNIEKINSTTYLGKGKVKELALYIQQESIELVIFDNELSPRQQNNLEESIGCRVIDRTALILQIFADRANTREGKLQVELAQLNYILPRLIGTRANLSRLGGGIGTRGPGETKLETDRRHIRKKIDVLQNKIEEIKKQRNILRQKRSQNNVPVVALVGYTNAGKSTLLNILTQANVLTEDKLFATLDPKTKKLKLNSGEVLLTDTVGFIHKLPHQLVAAFRATLEEIKYADLLLHVVDCANSACFSHIESVNQVLKELDSLEKPTIMVFNKSDLVNDPIETNNLLSKYKPSLSISAFNENNIKELISLIEKNVFQQSKIVNMLLPFDQANLLNTVHELGNVTNTEYTERGILCSAYLPEALINKLKEHIITED
ncbi:MAG: GTPase HflX [Clostridia bacterium]|nr:GTPase HflX [Clostridia bacterium]